MSSSSFNLSPVMILKCQEKNMWFRVQYTVWRSCLRGRFANRFWKPDHLNTREHAELLLWLNQFHFYCEMYFRWLLIWSSLFILLTLESISYFNDNNVKKALPSFGQAIPQESILVCPDFSCLLQCSALLLDTIVKFQELCHFFKLFTEFPCMI